MMSWRSAAPVGEGVHRPGEIRQPDAIAHETLDGEAPGAPELDIAGDVALGHGDCRGSCRRPCGPRR